MFIPPGYLRAVGVPDVDADLFDRIWPEGADLDLAFVRLAIAEGVNLDRLARRVLSGRALSRYVTFHIHSSGRFCKVRSMLPRPSLAVDEARTLHLEACGMQFLQGVSMMGGLPPAESVVVSSRAGSGYDVEHEAPGTRT